MSLQGTIETKTFSQLQADVHRRLTQLRARGFGKGDLVGILGPNSYDWIVADLALLTLGCVSVALPVELAGEDVGEERLVQRYRLAGLLVDESVAGPGPSAPAATRLGGDFASLVRHRPIDSPDLPADVFTVAFSSGTAGRRKGLLLSRAGVENTMRVSAEAWKVGEEDDFLISLPLANFQQRNLLYLALARGAGATLVPIPRMFQALRALQPTILVGPPSFFEILPKKLAGSKWTKRCHYFAATALDVVGSNLTRRPRRALGRRWTDLFGRQMRLMLVGSAPVPRELLRTFQRLGAPLYEVYGLTEVGWIAFNLPGRARLGTVGIPVPGLELALAADGELLVKAAFPQSLGYLYEGVDSEGDVFLPGGWVATGDLGAFDGAGFLRLIGRKKNLIITPGGTKVSPEALERQIEERCPWVERAVVLMGPNEREPRCLVWVEPDLPAKRREQTRARIKSLLGRAGRSRDIGGVGFRDARELHEGSPLLTANLKIRRDVVAREATDDAGWADS